MVVTPDACCPECGTKLDCHTGITQEGLHKDNPIPKPGDLAICGYCATPCRFTDDNKLVALTQEDIKDFDEEQKKLIIKAWWVVQMVKKKREAARQAANVHKSSST